MFGDVNVDNKVTTLNFRQSLVFGSLLFGLFFGAGNIIFPVNMGEQSGANWFIAAIAFVITAVGLPVIAVIASALSGENKLQYFAKPMGKKISFIYSLLVMLMIGPLFAIPRTATASFEVGLNPFFLNNHNINLYLFIFSFVFFILVFIFSYKPQKIIDIIGRFLTPLFLLLILAIIIRTFINPIQNPASSNISINYQNNTFSKGLLDGFQTMDLTAGVVFASTIISNIQATGIKDRKEIAKSSAKAGLFTIIAMAFIYMALAFLGATSQAILPTDLASDNNNGGLILSLVSKYYFGSFGQILLAAIVIIACLKTAIGLIVSISQAFKDIFPKTSYRFWQVLFVIVSFLISILGLNKIISLSLPFLMFLYPLTIVLTFLWILRAFVPMSDLVFKITLGVTAIFSINDLLTYSPQSIQNISFIKTFLNWSKSNILLVDLGLAWVIPAIIALVIALILFNKKESRYKIGEEKAFEKLSI